MNAANFDSAGISNGRDITELFLTVDYLLMMNVMSAFRRYRPITEVYNALSGVQKKNERIIVKAYREGSRILRDDLKESYRAGICETDAEIAEMKNPPRQRDRPEIALIVQGERKQQEADALSALQLACLTALNGSRKAYVTIASNLSLKSATSQETHNIAVDEVAKDYIETGNIGKMTVDGKEVTLPSYAAALTREASHQIYLIGGEQRRAEYGITLVEITTHASSCPFCRPWEGKRLNDDRFSKVGYNPKYGSLKEAIEKKLFHFNCRHGLVAVRENDPPLFIPANNPETAKLKDLTYDIEQLQRRYQLDIRKAKKLQEAALTPEARASAATKIADRQVKLRGLAKQAESAGVPFYRQNWREQSYFEFETFKPELADLRLNANKAA